MSKRFVLVIVLASSLCVFLQSISADPTALYRVLNSEIILNGPRAGGMGQASTATNSPAFLPDAPRLISGDIGYTYWDSKIGEDGDFLVESFGVVFPIKEIETTIAFRGLNFNTNKFGAAESDFTPIGSIETKTEAEEQGLLFAVGKRITDWFSIGLAQPLYYKTEVHYEGDNGKVQDYGLKDKFGPGIFIRLNPFKWINLGASYWKHRSTQDYSGSDFNGEETAEHEEIRWGIALHPDELTTIALDLEWHRTEAPLHSLVGVHEHFDWSNRWYTGIERWFKINSPRPNFALRVGAFDEESFTGGLSYRTILFKMPTQIDLTFVKDHSIKEFEEFEPGMYGKGAISGFLTVSILI